MTTNQQDPVRAWMESMGFEWQCGGVVSEHGTWYKFNPDEFEPVFVAYDAADIMYRQYLQGKVEELRKVCCCDVYPIDSKNEINVCHAQHLDRINQIEAELKELEEEK